MKSFYNKKETREKAFVRSLRKEKLKKGTDVE